ncbi:MAG: addiction module antidote protein [Nitrospirota bacterium]|nr:addiction module antidote protein [Nitrospirota bacterium]
MTKHKKLEAVHEEYFREHPDEIPDYLTEIFSVYAEDEDTAALLSQLRVIARVSGISEISQTVGLSRQGLQKALSENGNPRLANITAIMKAMGYKLTPQPLELR